MILRTAYIDRIRPFYDSSLIKVIVGVRRCGKSVLLRQIADDISSNDESPQPIIFLDFDDYDNRRLLDPDNLFEHIKGLLSKGVRSYLFFDEIQNVPNFETVINSLNTTEDVSIFITGSNSKLLSGELATKLGGRTLSFLIMPFTFKEFCQFKEYELRPGVADDHLDPSLLLDTYLKWGGFPLVCAEHENESRRVVLDNLYSSIVLRDIIQRNKVGSVITLENVLDYLIANSSSTVSGNNIANALSDSVRKVSAPTVYDLLRHIEEAYIVNRAVRYDIRGKRMLSFEAKEYVCDLGLFHMKKSRSSDEWGRVVETVVYNELLARGMRVFVGKTRRGEIDFVVESGERRCYIQAAYLLATEEVATREFGAFDSIQDGYPRYVVSMDPIQSSRNGVTHLRLIDFLLDESLLVMS